MINYFVDILLAWGRRGDRAMRSSLLYIDIGYKKYGRFSHSPSLPCGKKRLFKNLKKEFPI
jgi:hypothetical protein